MAKDKLSERQSEILNFIRTFQHESGYPPTIRQIGESVGISSTSVVNYNLNKLEKGGYLTRDLKVSRGLRLAHGPDALGGLGDVLRIPLVGRIFASAPVPVPGAATSFAPDEAIEITRSLVKDPENLFALQVRGDSMIDAMVNDGDIVVMRRQEQARNGEMVAVWLNEREETTLKHFFLENGRVRLQPANPTMGPIYADPANVRVQGKVVLVLRQMK
ncbi:MAG: repressor LexA [Chloroflexi bacterium]|nr:repressor LexA [Chloroflexota bacterium]MBI2976426.1 repressor LexA [Chloroflexota bacterium]MBI3176505.1 repressor LexA [Chloroflexota bacterium]MBI5292179.1 repressor LexA [Chloroflexota bacterium]MBI5829629.1 repressor LexA [Chloroflexota bacterium]